MEFLFPVGKSMKNRICHLKMLYKRVPAERGFVHRANVARKTSRVCRIVVVKEHVKTQNRIFCFTIMKVSVCMSTVMTYFFKGKYFGH